MNTEKPTPQPNQPVQPNQQAILQAVPEIAVPTPPTNHSLRKLNIFLIVFIVLLGGAGFFVYKKYLPLSTGTKAPQLSSQTLQELEAGSAFPTSEVDKRQDLNTNSLVGEFASFFDKTASDAQAEGLYYKDTASRLGYHESYTIPGSTAEAALKQHLGIAEQNSWKVTYQAVSSKAGVLDLEKSLNFLYKVQITYQNNSNGGVFVDISYRLYSQTGTK